MSERQRDLDEAQPPLDLTPDQPTSETEAATSDVAPPDDDHADVPTDESDADVHSGDAPIDDDVDADDAPTDDVEPDADEMDVADHDVDVEDDDDEMDVADGEPADDPDVDYDDVGEVEGEAEMRDLIDYIAKTLVDEPDQVHVRSEWGDGRLNIKLKVADGDKGKVIGRRGRVVHAMQSLLRVAATKSDMRAGIDVE